MLEKSPYASPGTSDLYTAATFGVCRHTRIRRRPSIGAPKKTFRASRGAIFRRTRPKTTHILPAMHGTSWPGRSALRRASRAPFGRDAPRTSPVAIARVLSLNACGYTWIATRGRARLLRPPKDHALTFPPAPRPVPDITGAKSATIALAVAACLGGAQAQETLGKKSLRVHHHCRSDVVTVARERHLRHEG